MHTHTRMLTCPRFTSSPNFSSSSLDGVHLCQKKKSNALPNLPFTGCETLLGGRGQVWCRSSPQGLSLFSGMQCSVCFLLFSYHSSFCDTLNSYFTFCKIFDFFFFEKFSPIFVSRVDFFFIPMI